MASSVVLSSIIGMDRHFVMNADGFFSRIAPAKVCIGILSVMRMATAVVLSSIIWVGVLYVTRMVSPMALSSIMGG